VTEARSRIESARRETAEEVAKILETSVRQAESVKRQIIGAAELEARNAQLKSLERAVNEVFELATKEISDSSGEVHERSLARLIEEGVRVIGPHANVRCGAKDKKAAASVIRKLGTGQTKLTLEDEPANSIGGVVLTSSDGSVKFDNTYEARLERMRPSLRKEVAVLLMAP
jgi:V/A-type H+-transporting ATPase subunit E